jgi:hypothetical protein
MTEIEIWKPLERIVLKNGKIFEFEGYEVSSLGRVRTYKKRYGLGPDRRILNKEPYLIFGRKDMHGYSQFCLYDKNREKHNFRTHVLVMQTFIGAPKSNEVTCHWDDDKNNNKLSNLRYATQKDNGLDRVRNKKMRESEKSTV